MDLNDKIKQMLVDKSISPSHFADEIGVQRSSISHILAGRNRPSLDIVQKIIRRYPDLGMEWILEEEELPSSNADVSVYPTGYKGKEYTNGSGPRTGSDSSVRFQPPTVHQRPETDQPSVSPILEKSVERILVFYTDGTFKQYLPD